jgi:hypothetical protein
MSQQGRYWILTIPHQNFTPYLPNGVQWIKGQLECGAGGFLHWQIIVGFNKNKRLGALRDLFGPHHAELTRSAAAAEYVWKDETAVSNTRFELGQKALKRNSETDWDSIREMAKKGRLNEIPSDIYIRSYSALKMIAKDHMEPVAMERFINVYWGATGTGKSRRAWDEATFQAYPKDPCTKFWDGYRPEIHKNVVCDEFTGTISLNHMLRWLDRYPVIVEAKHGACVFAAERLWLTSNIDPREWYPDAKEEQKKALLRRLNIVYFPAIGSGE